MSSRGAEFLGLWTHYNAISAISNEKGRKVEAYVAMYSLLSMFRREENRDGVAYVLYALHC